MEARERGSPRGAEGEVGARREREEERGGMKGEGVESRDG